MNNKKTLTAERVAEIRAKGIDFSDIPEITDFSGFVPLALHSECFKPLKEAITIRLDKALTLHLRSKGRGWQTIVNDFLVNAYRQGQI